VCVCVCRSIRVFARADALFTREADGVVTRASARFVTHPQDVNAHDDVDLSVILRDLNLAVDNWNSSGSGYDIERVTRFVLCICRHRPLDGSSGTYVPTPKYIRNKNCVRNVKSNDNRCFVWAVLAALYPPQNNHHTNQVSSYVNYRHTLNLHELQFPMHVKDIAKFEKNNPSISVNCLYFDEESKDFTIEYLSHQREREKHVNLLLLGDEVNPHFVCITNMSRLVYGRTKHKDCTYVCDSCLTPFSSQKVLDNHIPFCVKHFPQQVVYPTADNERECTLKFTAQKKTFKVPFYLICDLESFLTRRTTTMITTIEILW